MPQCITFLKLEMSLYSLGYTYDVTQRIISVSYLQKSKNDCTKIATYINLPTSSIKAIGFMRGAQGGKKCNKKIAKRGMMDSSSLQNHISMRPTVHAIYNWSFGGKSNRKKSFLSTITDVNRWTLVLS